LTESVARWDNKSPAWVESVMPGEAACFAYGFTGCPRCGARWGTWGCVALTRKIPAACRRFYSGSLFDLSSATFHDPSTDVEDDSHSL